ncbi:MAG: hypothetical protein EOM52_12850 [Clostridia bacterium]|nr:hypothetical protein [Clostridia bacterium]
MEYLPHILAGTAILLLIVVAWLAAGQRRLSALKGDVERASRQLTMHRALANQARDGPDAASARKMLDTSRMLYQSSAVAYNQALNQVGNRLAARVLGFRPTTEEGEP